jgi:hypothetical protein
MSTIRCLSAALALATTLGAQQPAPPPGATMDHHARSGALVHYGKWAAAALAGTFTALGAREHASSNRAFNQLFDMCRANTAECALQANGTYQNAGAEQLFQSSLHFDSRARVRLLFGQASLLLCAGLFFADLRHHGNGPDNIPYHPAELTVEPQGKGARIGLRLKL